MVFVSALALLVCSGIATYISFINFQESERWVSHTQEVRAAVGDLAALINDASNKETRYLMSGDADQLSAYRGALSLMLQQMQPLEELIKDNKAQIEYCKSLESLITARVRAWEDLIASKQQGRPIDLASVVQQDLDFSSESASVAEKIRAEEIRLLQERVRVAHEQSWFTRGTVVLSFALVFLLLYVHYRLLTSELKGRERAEQAARSAYAHEAALRQGEERFRLFVEAVRDYAIFMLDAEGRVSSWNQGAERIRGYKANEVLGKHFSCFYLEEDIRARKPERELEMAVREGRVEDEGWRVRKDGSRFWANVVITALRDERGKLIGFAKITRDVTERMRGEEAVRERNIELAREVSERKAAEERLAASARSLRELSFHLLRTQDEERRRIGRELHDSLGQYLAALKMALDGLQLSMGGNQVNGSGAEIDNCVKLAEESLREMRTISYLLYPPMLEEMGLRSAILWYIEGFSKRSGIETTLDVEPNFDRLAPEAELALFRILQESLTNVHRHSGSKTALVRLYREEGTAVLEIHDSGKGLPSTIRQRLDKDWLGSAGVGLRGMTERIRQFGGDLEVSSSANGTVVKASLPAEIRVLSEMTKSA